MTLSYKSDKRKMELSEELTDFLLTLSCLWLRYEGSNLHGQISRHLESFNNESLKKELMQTDNLAFAIIALGENEKGEKI
jgi:hypothetical protein|tara:strand:- start:254 stop:493 length:240 start_codon:yes stop_codon:yes gene_type:complete